MDNGKSRDLIGAKLDIILKENDLAQLLPDDERAAFKEAADAVRKLMELSGRALEDASAPATMGDLGRAMDSVFGVIMANERLHVVQRSEAQRSIQSLKAQVTELKKALDTQSAATCGGAA